LQEKNSIFAFCIKPLAMVPLMHYHKTYKITTNTMFMKTKSSVLAVFLIVATVLSVSCQTKSKKMSEKQVLIETTEGNITIKLYNETQQHRDNFLKLAEQDFYNGIIFHRVIKDFMIQVGDPDSKNPQPGKQYGIGGPSYTVPAEINLKYIHKKGALAAARTGDQVNPERKSSGSQFYIVTGKVATDEQLNQTEVGIGQQPMQQMFNEMIEEEEKRLKAQGVKINYDTLINDIRSKVLAKWETMDKFKYTPEQRESYKTIGGTPFLDGQYTVFGEVTQGLDIVEKIGAAQTAPGDRPVKDILILKMKVLK
jgi:cyclophilin family peptidyl-prolyl cis-trans isomerase